MIKYFIPEFFFSFIILFVLFFDSYLVNNFRLNFPLLQKEKLFNFLFILFLMFFLVSNNNLEGFDLSYLFIFNTSTNSIKVLFLIIILLSFSIIWRGFLLQRLNLNEYFILFFFSILSALFLINSNNFLSIYICLEMQSLCFYVLSAYQRKSLYSAEAGIKYFISSSIFSGIFLLGVLLCYCCLGTSSLFDITFILSTLSESKISIQYFFLLKISFFLILSSLFFKLVIAPYHVWFPQIYDGSPIASVIIFNIIPKLSIFIILLRVVSCFSFFFFKHFILIIGIYSILFGIVKGLKQKRLKKLFIYSSISQMGLPLCAVSEFTIYSITNVFIFLLIYLLTSILMWGLFLILCTNIKLQNKFWLDNNNIYSIFLTVLANIKTFNYTISFLLIIIFFSLSGIPPFIGFLSKTFIYFSLLEHYQYEIAFFLAYSSAFGIFYYIHILKISFFENANYKLYYKQQTNFFMPNITIDYTVFSIIVFFLIFFCFKPQLIFLICQNIVLTFFL